MDFLVESNIAFNGLNKLIFEYLNFRPFLDELLDITSDISNYIKIRGNSKTVDISYNPFHIIKRDKWTITYSRGNRDHLYIILTERNNKLGIKNNYKNFEYHNGLNLCYIYY